MMTLPDDFWTRAWPVTTRMERLTGPERLEAMWVLRADGTRALVPLPTRDGSGQEIAHWTVAVQDISEYDLRPSADLDRLYAAHPKARQAPPFRQVACGIPGSPDIVVMSEIVIMLPSGYFVGYVVEITTTWGRFDKCESGWWLELTLEEAPYCLTRYTIAANLEQMG